MDVQRRQRKWKSNVYSCVDGVNIPCKQDVVKSERSRIPRNGIHLRPKDSPIAVISLSQMDRAVTTIISGNSTQTYILPKTVTVIGKRAFDSAQSLRSVKFNEGLQKLEKMCFAYSGIQELTLFENVSAIEDNAFFECRHLQSADLRAANNLVELGKGAFSQCDNLKCLLLNDNIQKINSECFQKSGIEEIVIPRCVTLIGDSAFESCKALKQVKLAGDVLERIGKFGFSESGIVSFTAPSSLREIESNAFAYCKQLKQVDLSACVLADQQGSGDFITYEVFRWSSLESIKLPRQIRIIRKTTFVGCNNLTHIALDYDSALEEIGERAFQYCNLESFVVPRSLKKIGDMAFADCQSLKDFRLNENIQEIGWLCFQGTKVSGLELPPQIRKTTEQLGIGQTDPKVLRLPPGLIAVGNHWFSESNMEKLVVSSSVKRLGWFSFCQCKQLREVVFEPDSHLECIERSCFVDCGIKQIVFPKSVKYIGDTSFYDCRNLQFVGFEPDGQLTYVGYMAFHNTQLRPWEVIYPKILKKEEHGKEW